MNRNRNSLVWGGVLILVGIALLLNTFGIVDFIGRFVWAIILAAIGLPFLFIYLTNRKQWWALFPGCIMAGVGLGVLFGGELAWIIITASVGLPFWLLYFTDRRNWWALIPGWVMFGVSCIILLAWIGLDWFITPFVMFAIAAPFLLVYILHRDQWWALIPGGIMAGLGVAFLLGNILSASWWPVLLILFGILLIFRNFRSPPAASPFEQLDAPDPAAQAEEPR